MASARSAEPPIGSPEGWACGSLAAESVVSVPASDATLPEVMRFASTTYFGYDRHGGVEGLGALANSSIEQWRQSRSLPSSVQLIRASLFFESQRWHHFGYPPDDEAEAYMRALVERLQLVSGGTVKADGESLVWRIRRRLRRPRQ